METFKKVNYIVLLCGLALIVTGVCLMYGPGSTDTEFCPDIFSARRIKVAPLVCLAGYVTCGLSIFVNSERKDKNRA